MALHKKKIPYVILLLSIYFLIFVSTACSPVGLTVLMNMDSMTKLPTAAGPAAAWSGIVIR